MAGTSLAVLDVTETQERSGSTSVANGGIDTVKFLNYCQDIYDQPNWRKDADKEADYYDGNQLDQQTLKELEEKGMGPLVSNLIQPTVNVVLGMEAKTRTDWRLSADTDQHQRVAEALSVKAHEAERETRADRACSDAYAGQVKVGVGWCEVSKQSDPFKYPYRVLAPHRREIFWDWRDRSPDLQEGRYLIRRRWYDLDEAKVYFPHKADVLEAAGSGWAESWLSSIHESVELAQAFQQDRGWSLEEFEYRDTIRRRVCLYETWYRQLRRGYVLKLRDGRAVEMNLDNPLHAMAVARGMAKPTAAIYSRWGMAIFAGPHKLMDTGANQKRHPYIPFFGYREDLTGVPYGLIRSMISPQDEVNARRRKLLWLLSAVRLLIDSDALDDRYNTIEDVMREIARPDAMLVLKPGRQNKSGAIQIENNVPLAAQQEKVMGQAEDMIQKVAGVFNALMGRESSTTAGTALDTLVEQGSTVLAEINDNYRFSRRLVGEHLVDLIRGDIGRDEVEVMVGENPKRRKSVILNKRTVDPQFGIETMENDVQRAAVKVALEDVPSTPSYRQQQFSKLAEVVRALAPDVQAMMTPFLLEASDLPQRKEAAQIVRAALNLPDMDGEQDPQVAGLLQQVQALTAQLEQAAAALEDKRAREDREIAIREREVGVKEKAEENRVKGLEQQAALAEAKAREADARAESIKAQHARDDAEFALTRAVEQLGETVAQVQGGVKQVEGKVESTRGESEAVSKQMTAALKDLRAALEKVQADTGSKVDDVRTLISAELKKVIDADEKRTEEVRKQVEASIRRAAEDAAGKRDELMAAMREQLAEMAETVRRPAEASPAPAAPAPAAPAGPAAPAIALDAATQPVEGEVKSELRGVTWRKDKAGQVIGGVAEYGIGDWTRSRPFKVVRDGKGEITQMEFEDDES